MAEETEKRLVEERERRAALEQSIAMAAMSPYERQQMELRQGHRRAMQAAIGKAAGSFAEEEAWRRDQVNAVARAAHQLISYLKQAGRSTLQYAETRARNVLENSTEQRQFS